MEKVRFAVIGAGHIGKRHAEMVVRNPQAELVAMCDRRSKEDCLVDYDIPFFNSAEAMFDAGLDFDVVCVCTPNGLHAEHALAFSEAPQARCGREANGIDKSGL